MKRMAVAGIVGAVVLVSHLSYAQMMEQMERHMRAMGVEAEVKENTQEKYVKEAEAGGVTVKVAYLNPGKKAPQFEITLDTHAGSLDEYRLGEITTLRDSSGREYRGGVISTTGSGHHIEALLEFKDADMESSKFAELSIKGLAGVDERVFRFELGGME